MKLKKMRLEDKNNSQKMMIGYFANTKSVFAGFLRVHGMSKIVFGVRTVFANKRKKHLQNLCKYLIFSVDQPGLEPGTSRL